MSDKHLKTLLYIDDDANLRALVEMSLTTIGNYSVKACASGAEALSLLQHYAPDMILLDMMMPDMDGFETLSRIRACKTGENIPVIFITGESDSELLVDTFKQTGVIAVISKPFNPMHLVTQIRNIWNQYAA